ncbi:MAG: NAD(P)-dependent oxidoreductase [Chloroflexi bacterium]|nr:NAD(P)-dependent oxidoreductase [Chloroflexota bacterium]
MAKKKVLVTGMSGLIGGVVQEHLGHQYDLRALNRSPVSGVPCYQADIANLEAIQPAFEGVDAVVHLAARIYTPPEARGKTTFHVGKRSGSLDLDVDTLSWEDALSANIVGTYNVFEASRRAGVKRVLFASAGWVTETGVVVTEHESGYPYYLLSQARYGEAPTPWPMITHESPIRPHGMYGVSKVFGEALARHYADIYGLSMICLRFGAITREDRPMVPKHWPVWCSHRDCAQMVQKCLDAPESLAFDIFFVVSDNKWGFRDFQHAREVVGFEPEDGAGDYPDPPVRGKVKWASPKGK